MDVARTGRPARRSQSHSTTTTFTRSLAAPHLFIRSLIRRGENLLISLSALVPSLLSLPPVSSFSSFFVVPLLLLLLSSVSVVFAAACSFYVVPPLGISPTHAALSDPSPPGGAVRISPLFYSVTTVLQWGRKGKEGDQEQTGWTAVAALTLTRIPPPARAPPARSVGRRGHWSSVLRQSIPL